MISGDFSHCSSLEDFNREIMALHAKHHGVGYLNVHHELVKLSLKCKSYKELGVNQGATLSSVLLTKPEKVFAFDIDLNNYIPYERLFCEFSSENNVKFFTMETSSTEYHSWFDIVDLLYIDTLHRPEHLKRELLLHHNNVQKYIVCHDTSAVSSLHNTIVSFCENHPWKIIKRDKQNVGFTTIERIA